MARPWPACKHPLAPLPQTPRQPLPGESPLPDLAALLVAGCSSGSYPSLQRWPTPQPQGRIAAPAAPEQTHTHVRPGCDMALADSIHADFSAALPSADTALKAASDATPGSPTWSKGNIALAGLQQIRARLAQVLAPAEEAYVADTIGHAQDDARTGEPPREDGARLVACRAHVDELAAQEDAQIERLHARLPD
jgi:hypothetical protein